MSAFCLLAVVARCVNVRNLVDKTIIDKAVLYVHGSITLAVSIATLGIIICNEQIGADKNCPSDADLANGINTYCWKTFTTPENQNKSNDTQVEHPGLGVNIGEKEYHSYYQSVPFMLFFQFILFFVPYWIWKSWMEGNAQKIIEVMGYVEVDDEQKRKAVALKLAKYIFDTFHLNNRYVTRYYLCVALNFVVVLANIFFIYEFLSGTYITFGTDVVTFRNMIQEQRSDSMIQVLPRVTNCSFEKLGLSGSIEKFYVVCVHQVDVLKEKIYIMQCFCFIFLAIMFSLSFLCNMVIILLPSVRKVTFEVCFEMDTSTSLSAFEPMTQIQDLLLIVLLRRILNKTFFKEVIDELSRLIHASSNGEASSTSVISAPLALR